MEAKVEPFKIKNMKNLVKAVVSVSSEVRNIEKNLNVGTGNFVYKGIADKDVKNVIGKAMIKNGLAIFPVKIEPTVTVEKWEEVNNYKQIKKKQSVFTEVVTTYKLYHESGESIELQGYGHGVDSQDKSAGKATTYALKYTLLYNFMVATGSIDDSDNSHSDDIKPPVKTEVKQLMTDSKFEKAKECNLDQINKVLSTFKFMKPQQRKELEEIRDNLNKK
tara:strand:- start:44 stop:703 length:660 start_codon:yes stop_codon:yes gene_type:complete